MWRFLGEFPFFFFLFFDFFSFLGLFFRGVNVYAVCWFRDAIHLLFVMVLTSEGYFYLYSIDLEKSGECALLKQYK